MTTPDITGDNRNSDGTFKQGFSGNPNGRPKGVLSLRDEIRKHLEDNPQDVKEVVQYFVKNNRELMWQMLEGRPKQVSDVTLSEENQSLPNEEEMELARQILERRKNKVHMTSNTALNA
jgi:hypothetical protein